MLRLSYRHLHIFASILATLAGCVVTGAPQTHDARGSGGAAGTQPGSVGAAGSTAGTGNDTPPGSDAGADAELAGSTGSTSAEGGQGGGGAAGAADDAGAGPSLDAGGSAGKVGGTATADGGGRETAPPPTALVYEAETGRTSGDAVRESCSGCSGGKRVRFGADSILTISNVEAGTGGTKMVLVRYTNGDVKDRSIYVGVNGNASQAFWWIFKPTGSWDKVSSMALALSGFRPGSNNSLTFFIDTELDAAALDRIEILPDASVAGTNFCDRSHWAATASVTAGDGAGPQGAIDGDLKTRWGSNHPQDGTDWFQVDFGGLVKLANITLDNSQAYPTDYPGKYEIYSSVDGVTFDSAPFVAGSGASTRTIVDFMERTVRAVKITEIGSARAPRWWQIGELTVGCRM